MATQEMIHTIAEYFKTQPVVRAWLFGSCSRGEQNENSDVDIIVALDHEKPIGLHYFSMILDLEKLLHRQVDLVEDGQLMSFARPSADRDKILIYERAGS